MKGIHFLFIEILSVLSYSCTGVGGTQTDYMDIVFEEVINHYQSAGQDSLKLKAVYYLRENYKWHSIPKMLTISPKYMQEIVSDADSVYAYITQGVNNEVLQTGAMSAWLNKRSSLYSEWCDTTYDISKVRPYFETKRVGKEFFISHIDNAFARWESSPYAKGLDFETFCEYILPFVALDNGYYLLNGAELYRQFSSTLEAADPQTLPAIVYRYSQYIEYMRKLTSFTHVVSDEAWQSIFFNGERDCIPCCEIECCVLRAMGVPAAVDMNIGNREYCGQHYHCVVFDKDMNPYPFHAEKEIAPEGFSGYAKEYKMNIYRFCYGPQEGNPFMMKGVREGLPEFFRTPCIKDVTSYIKPTLRRQIPLPRGIKTNLTWLYSFSRNDSEGTRAITWGVNDTINGNVMFDNVIPNMLYFPAIINAQNEVEYISSPFVLMQGLNFNEYFLKDVSDYATNSDTVCDIVITRKFPRKPSMLKEAQNMVGGVWYGANSPDGKDKVKLAEIKALPEPRMQEIQFCNKNSYKYYLFEAASGNSVRFGEIEFITRSNGTNVRVATRLPITSPLQVGQTIKMRMQAITKDNNQGAEFDGNPQTSNYGSRFLYEFDKPQQLVAIAYEPIHADNNINPNEDYTLYVWDNGWKETQNIHSTYNFLEFKQLDTRKLYWLKNNSRGREEVPFLIVEGKQKFLYYDCLIPLVKPEYIVLPSYNYSCTSSSEEPEDGPYEAGFARYLVDADTTNFWHSQYSGVCPDYPHWIQYDIHSKQWIDGVIVKLRDRDNKPKRMRILTSINEKEWTDRGVFELRNSADRQELFFSDRQKVRYIKFVLLEGQNQDSHSSIMYIKLFKIKNVRPM